VAFEEILKLISPFVDGMEMRRKSYRFFVVAVLISSPAFSHQAPLGWEYDIECCSMTNCWEEGPEAVVETARGYRVIASGELILYGDKRIKKSKDQFFHRCTATGFPTLGLTICLYVPPKSF
jgi:hypothetical protein